jgi:hypothetical protein
MTKYLVTIHHPHDYDPSLEDEAMGRDIDALNEEMVAAGIRVFVGGLHAPSRAKSVRATARWQDPCHGRTLPGNQGARGRVMGARGSKHGRGPGVGAQSHRRLPSTRRSASVSLTEASVPVRSSIRLDPVPGTIRHGIAALVVFDVVQHGFDRFARQTTVGDPFGQYSRAFIPPT